MTDLGMLGGTLAFVNGIKSRSQVAGATTLAGDQIFHPFLWDQGKLMDLGTLGGNFVEVICLLTRGSCWQSAVAWLVDATYSSRRRMLR